MKMMKKASALVLAVCMMIAMLPGNVFAAEDKTVDVTTAAELAGFFAETNDNPVVYKNLTINIMNDINLSEVTWEPGFLNGYCGAETYTVNGNNHTITGLTGPLFDGTWAGSGKLYISDLTIADSTISGGADSHGLGAFIGHTEATSDVELKNCHLLNSKVTGVDWTGGLIGYAAGYGVINNGPVFETILIEGCTVKGNEITGAGSTGGIIGHATGNVWTKVTISGCEVKDNKVVCTDDSDRKAGSVLGTIGVAGTEHEGKTGGVFVDAIVKDNTVTSNNVAVDRIFGRIGSDGGALTVTGGMYYDCTRENCNAPEGDAKGTITLAEEAIFADEMYDVTVTSGKADISKNLLAGDTVTIKAVVPEGSVFVKWEVVKGGVTLADATKTETTFVVGTSDVEVKAILACAHATSKVVDKVDATCVLSGYTGDEVCGACGTVLKEGTVTPATGHTFVKNVCACGYSIEVEAEVTDTVSSTEVEVEEVKEVTVVEDENTVKAEASVSAEATEIITAVATEDKEAVEELVKEEVITKETAENIQKTVEAGDKVVSEIVVEEVKAEEVAKEVQTAIAKEAVEEIHKEAKVAQFLDISVFLKSEKTNETLGTINKLATPITITVAIPDDLQETGRVFYVLRNHDGVVEVLKTTNNGNGTISFTTDQFSTYALAYTDVKAAPATGDNSAVMSYAVVAIVALAVVVVLKKRNSIVR